MVASFGKGSAADSQTAELGLRHGLTEREHRLIYAGATAALLLIALLILAFSGRSTGVSGCKGILLQVQRNSCFQGLAYSESNATICGYINSQSQKYSCIVAVAESQRNASACSGVDSTNPLYSQCVLNVSNSTGNENYCNLLNAAYKSQCIFGFAKAGGFGSMGMCDSISNGSLRNECVYLNYYNSALSSRNATYCRLLPSFINYTLLSLMVSANASGSSNFGGQQFAYSAINATPQGYCYYQLAAITNNKIMCAFTTGVLNEVCTASFAHANTTLNITNIATLCSAAPSYFQSLCINGVLTTQAIRARNISKCLQVSSQYQPTCITQYAIKYVNASYCSYIVNSTLQGDCYISVTHSNSTKTP